MNKRQVKKYWSKISYPMADEANLLTYNEEEHKQAIKDFNSFCFRYCHYHHYKDKENSISKPLYYFFPLGESTKLAYEKLASITRSRNITNTIAVQSLDDYKEMHPDLK